MRKILVMIIMATSSILAVDTQVPSEVQKVVDESLAGKGRGFFSHFEQNKRSLGCDSSTKLSELKAGAPIIIYRIPFESLVKIDDTTPVSEFINNYGVDDGKGANGEYDVPLLLKGKIISFFYIWKSNQKSTTSREWKLAGHGGGNVAEEHQWQSIIDKWPKSKGYTPILLIISGPWFPRVFVYIPQEGDYNLTPIRNPHHPDDSLAFATDSTFRELSDSRKVLQYLKSLSGHIRLDRAFKDVK